MYHRHTHAGSPSKAIVKHIFSLIGKDMFGRPQFTTPRTDNSNNTKTHRYHPTKRWRRK